MGVSARKRLEKDIAQVETDFAAYSHAHEEYLKAYQEATRALKWHCGGIRKIYKGVRFDCERERVEAQNQFFSRRTGAECLIGKETPYDADEDENDKGFHDMIADMSER